MDKFLLILLRLLLSLLSEGLKKQIGVSITSMEASAKNTPNKFDDVFVALLRELLLGDDKAEFKS